MLLARFVRLLVFTLEVAVACMSRFVDQFVLLFDASKLPTDPCHSSEPIQIPDALRSISFLVVFVRYSSGKTKEKFQSEKQCSYSSASACKSPSSARSRWPVADWRYRLRRSDAHMRLGGGGSVKPLLCALGGSDPPSMCRVPRGLGSGRAGRVATPLPLRGVVPGS